MTWCTCFRYMCRFTFPGTTFCSINCVCFASIHVSLEIYNGCGYLYLCDKMKEQFRETDLAKKM